MAVTTIIVIFSRGFSLFLCWALDLFVIKTIKIEDILTIFDVPLRLNLLLPRLLLTHVGSLATSPNNQGIVLVILNTGDVNRI